jgi:hypothetical protein
MAKVYSSSLPPFSLLSFPPSLPPFSLSLFYIKYLIFRAWRCVPYVMSKSERMRYNPKDDIFKVVFEFNPKRYSS